MVANWRDRRRSGDGGDRDGELASLRSHHNGVAWFHARYDDSGFHSGHIWPCFGRRRPRRLDLLRFRFQGYIPLLLFCLARVGSGSVAAYENLSCSVFSFFLMVCGYE